jgi:hypothetical protein
MILRYEEQTIKHLIENADKPCAEPRSKHGVGQKRR